MSQFDDFEPEGAMPEGDSPWPDQPGGDDGPSPYDPRVVGGPTLGPSAMTDPDMVMLHLAAGAKPEDFHPNIQPLADGLSILFQPSPPKVPGLLGSLDDIRNATAGQTSAQPSGQSPPDGQAGSVAGADGPITVTPQSPIADAPE